MESLTFPILASAAIALWTVANCVGTWASQLDKRVKLVQLQSMSAEGKPGAGHQHSPLGADFDSVDILDEPGGVDILEEEPEPMQQAA